MKKQYVKKLNITAANLTIDETYTLPPDFQKLTGVLIECEDDTMSQQDTISMECNSQKVISDYPDSEGVSARLFRYDQNSQFPIKDSILPLDIPKSNETGRIQARVKWKSQYKKPTGFAAFWVKIYFLGE